MKYKKAVSPVVSTVLLIMIVIVIAIIILLWARGFVKEVIEKNIGGNVKRANEYCNEVQLTPIVNDDDEKTFGFRNDGNVPIYQFHLKVKEKGKGSSQVIEFTKDAVLNPGFAITIEDKEASNGVDISGYDFYEEIKVIPVLLGKTENGGVKSFVCPEETAIKI